MSASGVPHKPKEGWQTRWVLQSGGLLLRFPLISIIGICGIMLCAMLNAGLMPVFSDWGFVGDVSSKIILFFPAMLVPVVICACLGISEGHGIASWSDIIKGLWIYIVVVFFHNVFVSILAIIMFELSPDESSKLINYRSDDFLFDRSDDFLYDGISLISRVFCLTFPFNMFWVALITQMPMSLTDLCKTGSKMSLRCFGPWMVIFVVVMYTMLAVSVLPSILGMVIVIFLNVWLYVAARELFGGISSNRRVSNTVQNPVQKTVSA